MWKIIISKTDEINYAGSCSCLETFCHFYWLLWFERGSWPDSPLIALTWCQWSCKRLDLLSNYYIAVTQRPDWFRLSALVVRNSLFNQGREVSPQICSPVVWPVRTTCVTCSFSSWLCPEQVSWLFHTCGIRGHEFTEPETRDCIVPGCARFVLHFCNLVGTDLST